MSTFLRLQLQLVNVRDLYISTHCPDVFVSYRQ